MGLDRLIGAPLALLMFVAAACDRDARPARLLDGRPAAHFRRVDDSILTTAHILRRPGLGRRLESCLFRGDRPRVAPDALVVERVGVVGESLTFANRGQTGVYACDGGIDPAGERAPPWCGAVFGELVDGRLLDPRLDVICRTTRRMPLAYVFVDPVPGAHWVGVDQDGYVELYEVLGAVPVRVASTRHVDTANARASFTVAQYDVAGRLLTRQELEAAVAG